LALTISSPSIIADDILRHPRSLAAAFTVMFPAKPVGAVSRRHSRCCSPPGDLQLLLHWPILLPCSRLSCACRFSYSRPAWECLRYNGLSPVHAALSPVACSVSASWAAGAAIAWHVKGGMNLHRSCSSILSKSIWRGPPSPASGMYVPGYFV